MPESLNIFLSNIEPSSAPVIAGIDEAGRGPVVGPMVYAIYVMPVGTSSDFRDSKLLTPQSRGKFFEKMRGYATYAVDPVYITSHMEGGTKTLNEIAMVAVVELLRELQAKCRNVQAVYVDGLGNNENYKKFLSKHFNFKFIVESFADKTYQVVSAASIVAKVTRDKMVERYNCGSGYPSDPITVSWLKKQKTSILGFPRIVRHSWLTVKRLLPAKKSRKLTGSLSQFYATSL